MTVSLDSSFMHPLISIARLAGEAILEVYHRPFDVEFKPDHSPVTEADRKADDLIRGALEKDFDGRWPIISEENHLPDSSSIGMEENFWLVDPLDGTKEFIRKKTDFTVNIALVNQGIPVAGVVYAPVREKVYWGTQGEAFLQEKTNPARAIRCREVPKEGYTAVVSRSHYDPKTDVFLKDYPVKESVSVGSSLKFCLLAEGEADIYPRLGPTMEWDTAAGHAVLISAGGEVLTLEDKPLGYGKAGFFNPHFYARKAL